MPDRRILFLASMRPSDITDGIPQLNHAFGDSTRCRARFNEAVGYYRRNPASLAL